MYLTLSGKHNGSQKSAYDEIMQKHILRRLIVRVAQCFAGKHILR